MTVLSQNNNTMWNELFNNLFVKINEKHKSYGFSSRVKIPPVLPIILPTTEVYKNLIKLSVPTYMGDMRGIKKMN